MGVEWGRWEVWGGGVFLLLKLGSASGFFFYSGLITLKEEE